MTRSLEESLDTLRREGVAVVPGALSPEEVAEARDRLWAASAESVRRGVPTHHAGLDPNAANVRVFDLVELDPWFARLFEHPAAEALTSGFLGVDWIVSNLTANIARPGSGSMFVHSDQALVAPEPWSTPWSLNCIWCLDDVHPANGATRYVPGSNRWASRAEVPADVQDRLVPFEAPAGSIVAMEGRVWHTSGRNITADEDRALVFAYCTKPFVRPQWNFSAALRPEIQAGCSPSLRYRFGLDVSLNVQQAAVFAAR